MANKNKNEGFLDNLKELVDGGYIMLLIFGGTLCFMASTSLIAALFTENPSKITFLTKILDTLTGFIGGAFMTMWNNQHYKAKKTNGNVPTEEEKNHEKILINPSNPSITDKL